MKQALRFGLYAFLSIVLIACNKQDTPKNELHLYNWNNYIAPSTIEKFEAQCQCKVVQDYYSDNEELISKLTAGAKGYDLYVPTGNALQALIKQNALQPIDYSKVNNLNNIAPAYLNTAFDPNNKYSVPYAYTTTIIGYNTERIAALGLPTDSWALIFEPTVLEKIKGKVTVLDSQRELMAAALKYLGYSANDTDNEHWKKAAEVIKKAKPYWAAMNNTYIKDLTVGNIWVAHGYSNDMYQANADAVAAKRNFQIKAFIPKEGATLSLDSLVIAKDAPRADLAHQFIQFILDGKNSAELSNMIGAGNPNSTALAHIKPEVTSMPVIFPDAEQQQKLEMLTDLNREQRTQLGDLWSSIKNQ